MNISLQHLKSVWFSNTRADILSGMTVALALIPEAIGFSIVAGVPPMVGLYTSFCIAIVISFCGGRPGMISAATGSMALLMVTLVKNHGIEYLFAATILTGILQIIFGFFRIERFLSFIPQSVMTGFVNALAILIFLAQMPQFTNVPWITYVMAAGTIAIVYLFPLLTKAVPSPLIAIVFMTVLTFVLHLQMRTVGDMGQVTHGLPIFHIPAIPFSFTTLTIIFPYVLAMSLVGILESLLTATIIDEMTETTSNKNQEIKGQGIANIVTGFFGGMGGCGMIGQSVINTKSGGRNRLSTLVAGVFLFILLCILGNVVKQIPMAALAGVMVTVAASTFEWKSLKTLHKMPRAEAIIMVITVGVVVATSDLSIGVIVGVILSTLHFGWRIAQLQATTSIDEETKTYTIHGQLFFGTTTHFLALFDSKNDPEKTIMDFRHSHIWDHSAIIAIQKVVLNYEQAGKSISIIGLNDESHLLVQKFGAAIPQQS